METASSAMRRDPKPELLGSIALLSRGAIDQYTTAVDAIKKNAASPKRSRFG